MLSRVVSLSVSGVGGMITFVETYITKGMNDFNIIGMAGVSVKEAKNRVIAAVKNSGLCLPQGRITVNLAPSDIRKEGTFFDLAISAGILCAGGAVREEDLSGFALTGELSLDGTIRPVKGVTAMCLEGIRRGIYDYIVPAGNAAEASCIKNVRVYPLERLTDLFDVVKRKIKPLSSPVTASAPREVSECFSMIKGQKTAKRALEIAASGRHNILMLGAVGSGKTMLAHSIRSILPPLDRKDIYDVTSIYSLCGMINDENPVIRYPPFREVHTGVTKTALIGG
ncbi:MAG: ATP-binding protein, partial [Clostridia bacterium]|nr:ATP-binding protein [Clostridia bacterium]